jgi:hypothetical protein
MKLRILNNSLRLRLSQNEVDQLYNTGLLESSMAFGTGNDDNFKYTLQTTETEDAGAQFTGNRLIVIIPLELVNSWAVSDQVTIDYLQHNGDNEDLRILVEKDFKCLTKRPGVDESDLFPHPESGHKSC